jgi:tripartite-type tricarboxylate transporter receptor subunit TctC
MKLPHRRQFLHQAAGAAALPAMSRIAWAQAYPTRTVTIIVPFAAGGATDAAARVAAEHMSHSLGQQFRIENVAGAGGTIGSTRVMRANPDGYTILMGHMGTHAVSVSLYPNLAYKPDVDFEPISVVVAFPLLVAARMDFPANDLKEFIVYVKANAGKLNMGHAGVGSNTFNFGLLLNSLLGVRPTLVYFTGAAPATTAWPSRLRNPWHPGSRPTCSGWDAQGICTWSRRTQCCHPECPDLERGWATGVPGVPLVCTVCPEGHATSDLREAQRCHRQGIG